MCMSMNAHIRRALPRSDGTAWRSLFPHLPARNREMHAEPGAGGILHANQHALMKQACRCMQQMPCNISEGVWQSELPLCARACTAEPRSAAEPMVPTARAWRAHRFEHAKNTAGPNCSCPGGWRHQSRHPANARAPILAFQQGSGQTPICLRQHENTAD